jgi:hypothetical protein
MSEEDIYDMPTVNLWAVHSTKENRPVFRGWAASEAKARDLLERMRRTDVEPDDEYWVERMTEHDFNVYKAMGIVPSEIQV